MFYKNKLSTNKISYKIYLSIGVHEINLKKVFNYSF